MCFVLNIFLKPQEGIRFYIFSQIFTSLKADRGIRVCYDLFSRGFLFAFYKPFCFGICSSTKKPTSEHGKTLIKRRPIVPHSVFLTIGKKKKKKMGVGWALVLILYFFPLSSISHTPIYKYTFICTHKQFKCAKQK